MKRLIYLLTLTLVLVACGTRSGYFKIEGHLLNLNQGEFYVYSTDGLINGIDTIKVEGGHFSYETPCQRQGILMLVFPNFSEQPIFAQPGKTAKIKGTASHLKEIEITGTDDNKLMTSFRMQAVKLSPPDLPGLAEKFIKENAQSPVALYLLSKFFVTDPTASADKANLLAAIVRKEQPQNGQTARLLQAAKLLKTAAPGSSMPAFSATSTSGSNVSAANLKGKIAVVYTWATWSSDSRSMMDQLSSLQKAHPAQLALLGICLDASKQNCLQAMQQDSIRTATLCDQKLFESPYLSKFGLSGIGDNVVYNAQGKVIAHGLNAMELQNKLKSLMK